MSAVDSRSDYVALLTDLPRRSAPANRPRHITPCATEDLKIGSFKPEYAGKMNFYLSAIDDLLRHRHDRPSIGLILCKSKNAIIAEYALRDTKKPIGISEYRATASLPASLQSNLPTIEDLEAELKGQKGTAISRGRNKKLITEH